MKKPYVNKHDYNFNFKKDGEINKEESQTVPDDTETLQEIFDRATRGIIPDEIKPNYTGVDNLEQIHGLMKNNYDLTDIDAMRAINQELNARIEHAERAKNEAEMDQVLNNDPDPVSKANGSEGAEEGK